MKFIYILREHFEGIFFYEFSQNKSRTKYKLHQELWRKRIICGIFLAIYYILWTAMRLYNFRLLKETFQSLLTTCPFFSIFLILWKIKKSNKFDISNQHIMNMLYTENEHDSFFAKCHFLFLLREHFESIFIHPDFIWYFESICFPLSIRYLKSLSIKMVSSPTQLSENFW